MNITSNPFHSFKFQRKGETDHSKLTDKEWNNSGHTGTANNLAAFDALGNPTNITKEALVMPGQHTIYSDNGFCSIYWNSDTMKNLTLTEDTTLVYVNDTSSAFIVNLRVTGEFILSFQLGTKLISGEYDGTQINLIQFIPMNGEVWITISQATTI